MKTLWYRKLFGITFIFLSRHTKIQIFSNLFKGLFGYFAFATFPVYQNSVSQTEIHKQTRVFTRTLNVFIFYVVCVEQIHNLCTATKQTSTSPPSPGRRQSWILNRSQLNHSYQRRNSNDFFFPMFIRNNIYVKWVVGTAPKWRNQYTHLDPHTDNMCTMRALYY